MSEPKAPSPSKAAMEKFWSDLDAAKTEIEKARIIDAAMCLEMQPEREAGDDMAEVLRDLDSKHALGKLRDRAMKALAAYKSARGK